ncbi:2-dehydro-3-deoxyphosphogluconate aldolase [Arthrobacter sp. RT-1]|uniref:bifunctional 4-hydroxy-2-oxoglutarate aldolase/2-dehydro-3-deoxy-phosphogluconate aldolase n=1 Tax=Arthrobacter sp. RT-1 TaxID=2292263 RepID=UPI000E1F7F43|nr:bifunctional 4-hydroxy-2-oxoglutarate aldolase/2-dehydro-3-deoxy-phosphogluconate aldolase [Arthrobacter sp. RT-1]RDV12316.1 2-dehydro-3-deoxyphosphogluconate aldolase [Arthrobacter sp. RT-1]
MVNDSDFFLRHLLVSPVIAILRGLPAAATVEMAVRCWDAGIRLVEVPLQSQEAFLALKEAGGAADGTERLIGAGTICTPEDVDRAQEAGAQFLIAPGFFPPSIMRAQEMGLPYLPGVATPTEMHGALSMSLNVQKLFPADMAGPGALKTLAGPFPQISYVAVGGVTPSNAQDFLDAGAVGVGVGSALSDSSALEYFSQLKSPTKRKNSADD